MAGWSVEAVTETVDSAVLVALLFFSDEFSRRKRSKSEDMDSVQSKRRRYMEEEYEAEFQVKITAKGDINQKLQKVAHIAFQMRQECRCMLGDFHHGPILLCLP